ncbi:MAG: HAD family hydrolase [Ramlibacter sp.]|nr:HAD family hydrolase [Ramlibacter sp.]
MRLARAFDLVIFDCDGVLVDSETIACATVASVLTRHGMPCDLPEVLTLFLGRSAKDVTEHYVQMAHRPLPLGFVQGWRAQLLEAFARELKPIDGVRELVEALEIPYCLASSSDEERIELALRKTGLWDLFEGRIFSTTMVANGKPAPDVFLLAASRGGAAPGRCLVIEDSVSGILAAKAAGMTAYGFNGGSHFSVLDQTQALVEAGADRIVGSMKEIQSELAS